MSSPWLHLSRSLNFWFPWCSLDKWIELGFSVRESQMSIFWGLWALCAYFSSLWGWNLTYFPVPMPVKLRFLTHFSLGLPFDKLHSISYLFCPQTRLFPFDSQSNRASKKHRHYLHTPLWSRCMVDGRNTTFYSCKVQSLPQIWIEPLLSARHWE